MKRRWLWLRPLLPLLLAFAMVAVLSELGIIEWETSIHDLDTALIFLGVLAAVLSAFTIISRAAVQEMERDALRRAREESSQERSRFLRRLDHELKNPLMAIKMAVANLANTPAEADRERLSADVNTQIARMTRLIGDLRKIGEIGSSTFEQALIEPVELLREVFKLAEEDPDAVERQLVWSVSSDLPPIQGDRDLLIAALLNLVNNALKFTQPGDRIELRGRVEGDTLNIEVIDSGMGISDEDQAFVWDELYRSKRVHAIPGSGIGLALVKLIVQRHGGRVSLTSELDRGTRVCMAIPLAITQPRVPRPLPSVTAL